MAEFREILHLFGATGGFTDALTVDGAAVAGASLEVRRGGEPRGPLVDLSGTSVLPVRALASDAELPSDKSIAGKIAARAVVTIGEQTTVIEQPLDFVRAAGVPALATIARLIYSDQGVYHLAVPADGDIFASARAIFAAIGFAAAIETAPSRTVSTQLVDTVADQPVYFGAVWGTPARVSELAAPVAVIPTSSDANTAGLPTAPTIDLTGMRASFERPGPWADTTGGNVNTPRGLWDAYGGAFLQHNFEVIGRVPLGPGRLFMQLRDPLARNPADGEGVTVAAGPARPVWARRVDERAAGVLVETPTGVDAATNVTTEWKLNTRTRPVATHVMDSTDAIWVVSGIARDDDGRWTVEGTRVD